MKLLLVRALTVALLFGQVAPGNARVMNNLYQVEVIVFERLQRPQVEDSETWPKNIELSYPQHWTRLVDPTKEAEREAAAREAADTASFSLSDDFLNSLNSKQAGKETGHNAQPRTSAPPDSAGSAADGGASSDVALNTFLSAKHRGLNDTKKALDRQHGYRILFHQTWLQSLLPPADAPALPITGGNQYGQHSELEGYLTLSVSRYLHVESHLWLTEFVSNYGQPMEHWPELPNPPGTTQARNSRLSEDSESFKADSAEHVTNDYTSAEAEGAPSLYQQWDNQTADPYADLQEAPYLIKNIAVLHQKRKMRSGEVHYIDHPKLGILIKIEPRTLEQARNMSSLGNTGS